MCVCVCVCVERDSMYICTEVPTYHRNKMHTHACMHAYRPKTQLYSLSMESGKGYNLDLSMFERLVRCKTVPHAMLTTQRRMLPAISQLVRETVYPELQDHPLVHKYPPVKGMVKPVVFFDHDHPEDGSNDDESKSKSNEFESRMIVGFVAYMLRQGYAAGQITVVTPYVGQLLKLR
jgi:superfamily I DNA and/or RNA helicase